MAGVLWPNHRIRHDKTPGQRLAYRAKSPFNTSLLVDVPPQTLDDIRYELPLTSIAQTPLEQRDAARLLVDCGDRILHRSVAELPALLRKGDLVVVNNTRVLMARIPLRRKTGGAVEVLLLEQGEDGYWEALVRPSKKLPPGSVVANDAMAVEIGGRSRRGPTHGET